MSNNLFDIFQIMQIPCAHLILNKNSYVQMDNAPTNDSFVITLMIVLMVAMRWIAPELAIIQQNTNARMANVLGRTTNVTGLMTVEMGVTRRSSDVVSKFIFKDLGICQVIDSNQFYS